MVPFTHGETGADLASKLPPCPQQESGEMGLEPSESDPELSLLTIISDRKDEEL